MINYSCLAFENLTNIELYSILALRQKVFILEQSCLWPDIDFNDQAALHCILRDENNDILAYSRIFDLNIMYEGYASLGRVVSSPADRKTGFGKKLMKYTLSQIYTSYGNVPIKIGAQSYLQKFYESFGFVKIGEEYLEDGIMHMYMIKA